MNERFAAGPLVPAEPTGAGRVASAALRPSFDDETRALCALTSLAGVGNLALERFRVAHGSLAAAVSQGGVALSRIPGLRTDAVSSLKATPDLERRGRWLTDKAAELGARVLVRGGPGYPALLESASGPPPVLYVLGELELANVTHRRVAVVGSRSADPYAIKVTRTVVDNLAGAGLEIVSGGAEGVDCAAHARALEVGARTVAVLGNGLLQQRNHSNRRLFDDIARHGAVISEFAMDSGGQRNHFPQRNRTIAGLSEAVIITRGLQRSGAGQTCEAAHRLGRPVFAVPGNVTEDRSATPNQLLRDGIARAALDGSEVARVLGLGTGTVAMPAISPPAAVSGNLSPGARAVLDALGPAPRHVDELAGASGLSVGETLAELLVLEMAGLCVTRPGKYFLRR